MENNFKKFIEEAKKVTLTKDERVNIGRILEVHIDNQPVINERRVRLGYQRSIIPIKPILQFMPIFLALIVAVSGGTALAANGSLPGDFLYPMKVGLNERIVDTLSLTDTMKAEHQSNLAARRIEEIQELAVRGLLNVEIEEEAGANFEQHMEKTLELIAKLEAAGKFEAAAEISSHLEALLNAHEDLINRISRDNDSTTGNNLDDMSARVNSRLRTVEGIRTQAEGYVNVDDDQGEDESKRLENVAEVKKEQSEDGIDDAKNLLNKYTPQLDNEFETDIQVLINAAEDADANGEVALTDGDFGAAFKYFQVSLRLTHQAEVMMRAWTSFRINVNGSASVNLRGLGNQNDDEQNTEDVDEVSNGAEDNNNNGNGQDEGDDSNDNEPDNVDDDISLRTMIKTNIGLDI